MNVKEFAKLYEPVCRSADEVDENLYEQYGVKRGLRDKNGKGVLTGVTNISKIVSSRMEGDKEVQCDGQLWYRGYNVIDMVQDFGFKRFGFEEVSYLLLFGELPTDEELANFKTVLGSLRTLPTNFTRDVIMKAPSHDIMNSMTKSVLTLSAYDDNVSDLSIPNVLEQVSVAVACWRRLQASHPGVCEAGGRGCSVLAALAGISSRSLRSR